MLQLKRYYVLFHAVSAWNKKFGPIDHLSLQRLIYCLQDEGVKLGYKFYSYYYGLYSPEIWGDLRSLEQDGLVAISYNDQPRICPLMTQWPLRWADTKVLPHIEATIELCVNGKRKVDHRGNPKVDHPYVFLPKTDL